MLRLLVLLSFAVLTAGFAGCNRFSGAYEASGSSIRFRPLVMTRMFCREGMELETGVASAFERVRRWELVGDTLAFRDAQQSVAKFVRAIPGSGV